MNDLADRGDKEMNLRFAGNCVWCGQTIPQNARAIYNRGAKNVRHIDCEAPIALGGAGGSAAREYERRLAREVERRDRDIAYSKERIQDALGTGFLGKVATFLAVDESPHRATQSTKAWSGRAVGEQLVGARLDARAEVGVISLHDRRIPGTRANIDHIAISPVQSLRWSDIRFSQQREGATDGVGNHTYCRACRARTTRESIQWLRTRDSAFDKSNAIPPRLSYSRSANVSVFRR